MEDMHIHLKTGVTDISIMKKYIEKCRELGINKVLFLDHGNRISKKHTPVLNEPQVIKNFFNNINIVQKENPDMEINVGIESDFSYDKEFKEKEMKIITSYPFDYVIGSVHGMEKSNYIDYLQANIDMLETYKIDIIGHLKLRKEYDKYKDIIEKIVKIATDKNVKFDINTSDRSRWNIQQLEYMLSLFKKYGTQYTIGSDAHCVEEIGYNIKEEYVKYGNPLDSRDIGLEQYYDENLKNNDGESRKEVTERMYNVFKNIIKENKGKKIAIFSHGASITFLLMKWCDLLSITKEKKKCLKFKNNIIVNKIFDAPEVFKIIVNKGGNIKSIENIEFKYS